jgi:HK97 family phage prohead protease
MTMYKAGDLVHCDMAFMADAIAADASETIPDGYIAGTASTPSIDLQGHRVLKGAFDESIKAKGLFGPKSIKLLAYHDWHRPAGVIKRLDTVGDDLKIGAQLNLKVGYVKDLHEISKQNGGLNFSCGFLLEKFRFVDDKDTKKDILVVEKGELVEVSVVTFPAQPDATMSFVKEIGADMSPSEFEKLLINNGFALNRNQAHKLMKLCKSAIHLFDPPVSVPAKSSDHPMLDARQLKAATDLTSKVRALLGSP